MTLSLDSNLIKNRSKSFSCLGSIANSSSNSTVISSSTSMHDFNHKPRSCCTDSSIHHNIKRFHPSQLGKPPGLSQQSSRSVSSSTSCSNEMNKPPPPLPTKTKIAPMKEVEKVLQYTLHAFIRNLISFW